MSRSDFSYFVDKYDTLCTIHLIGGGQIKLENMAFLMYLDSAFAITTDNMGHVYTRVVPYDRVDSITISGFLNEGV